jgi:hypothetical protein
MISSIDISARSSARIATHDETRECYDSLPVAMLRFDLFKLARSSRPPRCVGSRTLVSR